MAIDHLVMGFFIFSVVVYLGRLVWRQVRRRWPYIRLGKWMTGTVYIAKDRSIPEDRGIVKIGVTQERDVRVRMDGIRNTMGGDPACIWKLDNMPFPYAVEFAAHRYMEKHRVIWVRGSTRGREWFHAAGDKGIARAIAAVEKAARRVRRISMAKKRWSAKADRWISVWKLTNGKPSRTYPFSYVSERAEQGRVSGGAPQKKTQTTKKPTPPSRPGSRPRAAAARSGRH